MPSLTVAINLVLRNVDAILAMTPQRTKQQIARPSQLR
jgi:hypothetical protein